MIWLVPLAAGGELPEGWRASPPVAQTYAAQTSFDQFSSCSQSWAVYSARTAMVLTLEPGGTARACREKRADTRDPGGAWREEDRLGMIGSWSASGAWITLSLKATAGACEGAHFSARAESADWELRCTQAIPPAEAGLPGRPLVCQFTRSVYGDALGFQVFSLLPGPEAWIVLGEGAGLSIVQDDGEPWGPLTLTITPLSEPPVIGTIVGR
jgi:hypothetical protein